MCGGSDHDHDHGNTQSTSPAKSGESTSSLAASARFKAFAVVFGSPFPSLCTACELFNLPAFTYHPATNRIGFGWEAGRSGEGPAMYWYGWTALTLARGPRPGRARGAASGKRGQEDPLALLWLLPILAFVPLAYSLMRFWTK